jgi:hypothetical protein
VTVEEGEQALVVLRRRTDRNVERVLHERVRFVPLVDF